MSLYRGSLRSEQRVDLVSQKGHPIPSVAESQGFQGYKQWDLG